MSVDTEPSDGFVGSFRTFNDHGLLILREHSVECARPRPRPVAVSRFVTLVELPGGPWWSWEIMSYDGSRLTLAAGNNLTYHHELELSFVDVAYLSMPTQFEHPVFREPTDDEIGRVHTYEGEIPPVVVAFDVEANAGGGYLPCIVAAEAYQLAVGSFPRRLPPGDG